MDAIQEWTDAQARVIELVEDLDAGTAETPVPATPAWTVRQLLSHVIGLDADVLAGDEPDDHNSTWTQKQVDARADQDIASLVAEWRAMTEGMQAWMRDNGTRPMGDVTIHEQDLRGALNRPGAQDTEAMAAMRERMAGGFDQAVRNQGLAAIELRGDGWTFVAGDGTATVTVRAPEFELTRALMARRSAEQIRSWVVSGDVAPYLDLFGSLGPLPVDDLRI